MKKKQLLHTPEGVRDIYGKEYAKKLAVEAIIRKQMNLYGYQDIQTPTFEYFDVFSNQIGTTPSKDLFKFFDTEGNTVFLDMLLTDTRYKKYSYNYAEAILLRNSNVLTVEPQKMFKKK